MDKNLFELLEKTLISDYGEEKAYKILHADIPPNDLIRSLSMENFEFFVRFFLLQYDADPCGMVRYYFTNMPWDAGAVALRTGKPPHCLQVSDFYKDSLAGHDIHDIIASR